ncbi:MAG: hypothetical protein J6J65_09695 [Opitutales bacterium]|nr:hypothetical protein [Opitutales bacterium]
MKHRKHQQHTKSRKPKNEYNQKEIRKRSFYPLNYRGGIKNGIQSNIFAELVNSQIFFARNSAEATRNVAFAAGAVRFVWQSLGELIWAKTFGESPKAAKTGRLWAVGSSGIGLRRGSVVWGGNLPKNRKFEGKNGF